VTTVYSSVPREWLGECISADEIRRRTYRLNLENGLDEKMGFIGSEFDLWLARMERNKYELRWFNGQALKDAGGVWAAMGYAALKDGRIVQAFALSIVESETASPALLTGGAEASGLGSEDGAVAGLEADLQAGVDERLKGEKK
jgi:hypothetical protein